MSDDKPTYMIECNSVVHENLHRLKNVAEEEKEEMRRSNEEKRDEKGDEMRREKKKIAWNINKQRRSESKY